MPHHRHHKNQRVIREDTNNNDNHNVNVNAHVQPHHVPHHAGLPNNHGGHHINNNNEVTLVQCCVPSGCFYPNESIDQSDPADAVRVVCNNEQCDLGNWMHKSCFDAWEDMVLAYLKSCGRARSWSEKQRLQNLWTKKGYDLAFKACDCKCSRGHLRKDLDYFPPPKTEDVANKNKKKHKKKNDKPVAVVRNGKPGHAQPGATTANQGQTSNQSNAITNHLNNVHNNDISSATDNNNGNQKRSSPINTPTTSEITGGVLRLRMRTDSYDSTGSSPPASAGSAGSASPTFLSPVTNGNFASPKQQKPKFDFTTEANPQHVASLFRRRHDLSAFNVLPKHKQNPYHIKMEEDGPPGNDETRNFVLSHLSSYKIASLNCVLCKNALAVFDRYPMIDGTFFLSPQAYDDCVVQVISDGRLQFINAVCVNCLEGGSDVRCAACKRKWDGSTLLLGTMYSYDIFAAMPCCQKRLTCKQCRRAVVDVKTGLSFYSEYSRMIACPYCKAYDYHFIRPMPDTFVVKQRIWN